jgi:predicted ArsR family transcriptional regulator
MNTESGSPALREAPHTDGVDALAIALQDPTRRRILLALVNDGGARTVDEVAAVAGVHRTVAFGHLERLVALGHLQKRRRRGRRGKPASLYSIRSPLVSMSYPARQFQVLAGLLGAGLSELGEQGRSVARDRGRRYGACLARGPERTIPSALAPLGDELGADYAVVGDDVTTEGCIFREACDEARDVVCALHAGVLEGALGAAGIDAAVTPRGPVHASGCHFGVTPGASQRAHSAT